LFLAGTLLMAENLRRTFAGVRTVVVPTPAAVVPAPAAAFLPIGDTA
jgi:hypothetical protein